MALRHEDGSGATDAINTRIVLKGRPRGGVVSADLFTKDEAARLEPGPGELLIRVIYLSLDPAMRGWIAETPNYREPVSLGAVMPGFTVGEAVASKPPDFGPGQFVLGRQGWPGRFPTAVTSSARWIRPTGRFRPRSTFWATRASRPISKQVWPM